MEVNIEQGPLSGLATVLQEKLSAGLASVVRQPVQLNLGHLGQVPLSEISKIIGVASLASIYIPLVGDIVGDIFLFVSASEAAILVDLMMGNASGTTTTLGEFEASALKELGNISSGVIISEMANRLHLSIMLTVPNYTDDYAGAVIDQVIISYAETGSDAYAIHLPFTVEGHVVSGFFLILFDKPGLDTILSKIQATPEEVPSGK